MADQKEDKRNWLNYDGLNTVFLKNGDSFMIYDTDNVEREFRSASVSKEMFYLMNLTLVQRIVVESEKSHELKVHYVPRDEAVSTINPDEIERVEDGDAILERATFCQPYILGRTEQSWKYEED